MRANRKYVQLLPVIIAMVAGLGAQTQTLRHVNQIRYSDNVIHDLLPETATALAQSTEVSAQALPPVDGTEAPIRSGTLVVERGDTLQQLLQRGGAPAAQAYRAVQAIRPFYDPRKLQVNQEVSLTLEAPANAGQALGEPRPRPVWALTHVTLQTDVDRFVTAHTTPNGDFVGDEIMRELARRPILASGTIESNLFTAARKVGVQAETVVELIRLFSFDVDFQRDIRTGDQFEVLFDSDYDYDGTVARVGAIRYAALTVSGERKELFRHTPDDTDIPDYFDRKGHAARKALMKTPIDGARLSSSFGLRKHPILGYTRMHKGTDFAAPRGTPIMAAGNGTIEVAGRNGGYGNYIRIRHNGQYKTAYAHMSKFARGIRKGVRVRQGQTIGYVGSTGRSTGPHLHYEVHFNGKQVNSRTLKLPTGRKLQGTLLAEFEKLRDGTDEERVALAARTVQTAAAR